MSRKAHKTSNVILLSMAIFFVLFTITMTVTYWVTGGVPDTLIEYTLDTGKVEAIVLAGIKVAKVRGNKNKPEVDTDGIV